MDHQAAMGGEENLAADLCKEEIACYLAKVVSCQQQLDLKNVEDLIQFMKLSKIKSKIMRGMDIKAAEAEGEKYETHIRQSESAKRHSTEDVNSTDSGYTKSTLPEMQSVYPSSRTDHSYFETARYPRVNSRTIKCANVPVENDHIYSKQGGYLEARPHTLMSENSIHQNSSRPKLQQFANLSLLMSLVPLMICALLFLLLLDWCSSTFQKHSFFGKFFI
jgi:hypothetical protein